MASDQEIQTYLALWFQLGKSVVNQPTGAQLHPSPVYHANAYSPAFEQCWQIISQAPQFYYLEGTEQSIAELQSSAWELIYCARCVMPVPMRLDSAAFGPCPCQDLPLWPNVELPLPRLPINNRKVLNDICHRLTTQADIEDLAANPIQPGATTAMLLTETQDPTHHVSGHHVSGHHISGHHISGHHISGHHISGHHASEHHISGHHVSGHQLEQVNQEYLSQEHLDQGDQDHPSDRGHGPHQVSRPDLELDDTLSPADCAIALSIHSEHHRPGSRLTDHHSPAPSQDALGEQRQESLYQAQCQYHHHSPETDPQDLSTEDPAIRTHPSTDPSADHTWAVSPAISPANPSHQPYAPIYPHCQIPHNLSVSDAEDGHP
jgi:hypothetical protein